MHGAYRTVDEARTESAEVVLFIAWTYERDDGRGPRDGRLHRPRSDGRADGAKPAGGGIRGGRLEPERRAAGGARGGGRAGGRRSGRRGPRGRRRDLDR